MASPIQSALEQFGYTVIVANGQEETIDLAAHDLSIDAILLNLDFYEDLDGATVAQRIRDLRRVPIIFYSSHEEEEFLNKTESVDHYGLITKSASLPVLKTVIRTALRLAATSKELTETLESLRIREEQFKFAIEASNEGIWDWDIRGNRGYFSPGYYHMLGYEDGEFEANPETWLTFLHPEDRDRAMGTNMACIEGKTEQFQVEFRMRAKDNSWHWILGRGKSVQRDENGRSIRMVGTHSDITEQKESEKRIKNLLDEKELLLKEVHHRIKNNLATVASLLSLQAETLKDKTETITLKDAENRIQSLSILYDKLYRSEDYRGLSVASYIPELAAQIIQDFPHSDRIRLDFHIEDLQLKTKTLVNLGIIINELITNAMKYAFTGRNRGKILIELKRVSDRFELVVADDGIGLSNTQKSKAPTGFGLTLVEALSSQLGGRVSLQESSGSRVVVDFTE